MTTTVRHESAVFATATRQDGHPSEWETFYVIVPNVQRLTESRRVAIGRVLWETLGRNLEVWDSAGHQQQLHWAKMRMGRHKYVEVTYQDDGTFDYTTESSGGGGHSISRLMVIERHMLEV